ncbi:MAG: DNA-directed DNA polymerase II small subunit [Thermoplasmata archaeon]
MVEQEATRREVLDILYERGLIVGVEELEKILTLPEPVKIARLLSQKFEDRFLSLEDILSVTGGYTTQEAMAQNLIVATEVDQILASPAGEVREQRRMLEIPEPEKIKVYNADEKNCIKPTPELYSQLFLDRYRQIKSILSRLGIKPIMPIKTVKKLGKRGSGEKSDFIIVGIVNDAVKTKNGTGTILELEDDSGEKIKAHVPERNAKYFIKDSVVAIRGTLSLARDEEIIYASDVTFPDIPAIERKINRSRNPGALLCISDIHVGSRTFLYPIWDAFTDWLNGNSPEAKKVKYIVVAGDLVDGIGVYPNQEEELEIDDIYEQYKELARLFSQIPEHIGIIVIPGNHDAVRQAEPQPPLPMEIQQILGERVLCYSNPCYLKIEGVKILLYHGRSFDDIVEQGQPYLSYSRPTKMMKELLKLRHLAPTYGGKTPIAPMERDFLVIDDVPDIFVAGHVHTFDAETYRGTVMVNASTWQSQTEFQKQSNITPMPGYVFYYELDTGNYKALSFLS